MGCLQRFSVDVGVMHLVLAHSFYELIVLFHDYYRSHNRFCVQIEISELFIWNQMFNKTLTIFNISLTNRATNKISFY
jgi:hypothetical protein